MSYNGRPSGMLAESDWWGGVSQQEDCVEEGTAWKMVAGVSADGNEEQEWNQIEDNGSNIWRFFAHFDSDYLPDHAIGSDCSEPYSDPQPENFEYQIEGGEDPANLYFSSERPQDGVTEEDNDELGLLLSLLGTAGGTYTQIGSALVNYVMGPSDTTSVSYSNYDSEVNFDVPLNGSLDDLPQGSEDDSKVDVAEVALRVNNEFGDGLRFIYFLPNFTFSHVRTPSAGSTCYCNYNYRDYVTTMPDRRLIADYSAVE